MSARSILTAIRYVEREELKIPEKLGLEDRRGRAMSAAELSAQAAQRSARVAYVSQWIAIAAAIIAVLAVVIPSIR
jgi:hypothetical protein